MEDPDKDFVCRTKEILDTVRTKHDVSLLVNCTFGLVIFPHTIVLERLRPVSRESWWSSSEFWSKNLKDQHDLPNFLKTALGNNHFPKSIGEFLHKLRNALVHQEFEPINNEGQLMGMKWTIIKKRDLHLELKEEELRELLPFIANVYLRFLSEECN